MRTPSSVVPCVYLVSRLSHICLLSMDNGPVPATSSLSTFKLRKYILNPSTHNPSQTASFFFSAWSLSRSAKFHIFLSKLLYISCLAAPVRSNHPLSKILSRVPCIAPTVEVNSWKSCYGLKPNWILVRVPLMIRNFLCSSLRTGPGSHPASYPRAFSRG
jgi:hypothetical protein